MLKKSFSLIAIWLLFVATTAFAADPLHNTSWQTFDEKTGKPKSVIRITEKNGELFGTLTKVYDTGNAKACQSCKGKFAGKPLIGVTLIHNLQPQGKGKYDSGSIIDPQNGKTYKLKATLNGNQLKVRGFVGVSLLGRTQTWTNIP